MRVHGDAATPTLVYLPGLHGDWTLIGRFRKTLGNRVRFVEVTYPRTLEWSLEDYATGVEKALVADLVTDDKRGTAFGFYNLAYGITVFPASLIFGFVWTRFGAPSAFLMSAVISIIAAGFLMTVSTANSKS